MFQEKRSRLKPVWRIEAPTTIKTQEEGGQYNHPNPRKHIEAVGVHFSGGEELGFEGSGFRAGMSAAAAVSGRIRAGWSGMS